MLETNATIGYEFCNKYFEQGDKLIQVHLWDTAGQEKHSWMVATYYRKTAGAIIVYDITDYSTFSSLNKWIIELKNNNEDGWKIVIVGNKCDLEKNRAVSYEEGQEVANENDALFFETSAKSGQNVQNVFDSLITKIVEVLKKSECDWQNDRQNKFFKDSIKLESTNESTHKRSWRDYW